jgi:type VI protein secretion system component Hcp
MAYGTLTALVAGTATLTKTNGAKFYFVVNLDTAPLLLQFMANGSQIGQVALSAATAAGAPGGYLDSVLFPLFMDASSVVLTSTVSAAQVGCGFSRFPPTVALPPAPSGVN